MANLDAADTTFRPKPNLPPPPNTVGAVGWMRKNLFSSVLNTLLTLGAMWLILSVAYTLFDWGVLKAVWVAENRRECLDRSPDGACWAGVIHWFNTFMYGRYPYAEQWRPNLGLVILILWMLPCWLPRVTGKIGIALSAVIIFPFLAGYLFAGGEKGLILQILVSAGIVTFITIWLHVLSCLLTGRSLPVHILGITGFTDKDDRLHKYPLIGAFGLALIVVLILQSGWEPPEVGTNLWGGLFLTLVISGVGITTALPSGVLLALGRRSRMPIIRVSCIAFIELFRSVPLITILFMAVTMMPLFLPETVTLNRLVQVIIAVCLFAAAYMAEIVRGGLQAIPKGQYEAAQSMGLNYWKMMALVVMPQALKLMIPNIVGNFIGLFKDTTLVSIIGLYDLLLMLKAVSQNPQWNGLYLEPFMFGTFVFFIFCFAMSTYSQHLERTLGSGQVRR
ncbi:MAG: amino acid ABC transporter permease [Alphaproteobacteria bacterium]|nr:amino acid ABC transporter permease [Alphaproteobacteria bacterium]MBU0797982.1 amino acid ABC transporter permease [Alphaproteobacteria bacterium]MBU0887946.1 amino acid ABC transporter permease [Alphaproteobacteria bacterium]MBU1814831.1 amino acid ABC transporter permease [Alphaproteobacteria bacterium]MBU2089326.1 amino acid ABC transporter permease [Alphaproteobacteria bacterium]